MVAEAATEEIVLVEDDAGRVVLTSDTMHYYEEIDRDRPFCDVADLPGMYDGFDLLREHAFVGEHRAQMVGAVLHETGSGSEIIADAHVVAVCAGADSAAVVTSDPDDIVHLATAVRGVRIVTRRP